MLRLKIPKKAYWSECGSGVRVKVRPLTSPIFYQGRAFMEYRLRAIGEESLKDDTPSPSIESKVKRQALAEQYLTCGLARAGILEWEGILEANSDVPAPLLPEKIDELFENFWSVAEVFRQQYTGLWEMLEQEKNGSGLVSTGTSETGRSTTKGAVSKTSRVAKGKGAKAAKSVPT